MIAVKTNGRLLEVKAINRKKVVVADTITGKEEYWGLRYFLSHIYFQQFELYHREDDNEDWEAVDEYN